MALFFVTAAPLARAGVQRRVRAAPRACARVPANVGQSVAAASAAIDSAAADAVRRMQVALLVPGLNVQLENSFPYSDALLYTIVASLARSGVLAGAEVSLLFKSAGTAAAFQNEHRPLPDNVSVASFFGRDTPGAGQRPRVVQAPGFNVVVNPVSARGDPVLRDIRALVETAPDASWILLNPDFSGDRSALGVRDITEQNAFLDTFRQVYYFRNLVRSFHPFLETFYSTSSSPAPLSLTYICNAPRSFSCVAQS